jgi:cbb3-type cytochrome oxidase subunit 3
MFKQFTEHYTGSQIYLLSSLFIFVVFFIVVAIILLTLKKQHVDYMGQMPLNDNSSQTPNNPLQL